MNRMWKYFGHEEVVTCGEFLACQNPITKACVRDEPNKNAIESHEKFTWSFDDSLREPDSGDINKQRLRRDPPIARRQQRVRIPDPPQLVLRDRIYYTYPVAHVDTTQSEWWDVDTGDEGRESIKVWTESYKLGSRSATDHESISMKGTDSRAGAQTEAVIEERSFEPTTQIDPIAGTERMTGKINGDEMIESAVFVETSTSIVSMATATNSALSAVKASGVFETNASIERRANATSLAVSSVQASAVVETNTNIERNANATNLTASSVQAKAVVETNSNIERNASATNSSIHVVKTRGDSSDSYKIGKPDTKEPSHDTRRSVTSKEVGGMTVSSLSIKSNLKHSFACVEDLEARSMGKEDDSNPFDHNETNHVAGGSLAGGEDFEEIRAGIASITSNLTKTHQFTNDTGSQTTRGTLATSSHLSEWKEQTPDYANESEYSLGPGRIETEHVLDTLEGIIHAPRIPERKDEYSLKKHALEPPGSIRPSRSISIEAFHWNDKSFPMSPQGPPSGAIDLAHVLVRSPASVHRTLGSRKMTFSAAKSKDLSEDVSIMEDRPFIRRDIFPSTRTPCFYRSRKALNLPKCESISDCADAGMSVGGASDAATTDRGRRPSVSHRHSLTNQLDEVDDEVDTNCSQFGESPVHRIRRSGSNESLGSIGRNIGTIFVVNNRTAATVTRLKR